MKQRKLLLLLSFLSLFVFFFPSIDAMASENKTIKRIFDDASLLTKEEYEELEALYQNYVETNQLEIRLFTVNDLNGTTSKKFLEDYFDNNRCGYNNTKDCILMAVCMDPDNREVQIQGYGQAEYKIKDDFCDAIFQSIKSDMSNGNYYNAFTEFISQIDYYWNMDATTDYTHTEADNVETHIPKKTTFQIMLPRVIISIVIGGIVVFIMAFQSGGKVTTNKNTYLDQGNSGILDQYDRYVRSTVTKRAKPKESDQNNSGSSGGGVSSGGNSHSGGGGSF